MKELTKKDKLLIAEFIHNYENNLPTVKFINKLILAQIVPIGLDSDDIYLDLIIDIGRHELGIIMKSYESDEL